MKSISAVEYEVDGMKIRVTNQFKIEEAIMKENATRFKLTYSSPLFQQEELDQIERYGQNRGAKELI